MTGKAVEEPKVQRTKQRELDDLQMATKKMARQINDGPLGLPQLPFIKLPISQLLWVAAGVVLTNHPLTTIHEKGVLRRVSFATTFALPADGTNYRTFTLTLFRGGVAVGTLGSQTTAVAGIGALAPYNMILSPVQNTVTLLPDDVVALTLDGGGTKPALQQGTFTLYIQKSL